MVEHSEWTLDGNDEGESGEEVLESHSRSEFRRDCRGSKCPDLYGLTRPVFYTPTEIQKEKLDCGEGFDK